MERWLVLISLGLLTCAPSVEVKTTAAESPHLPRYYPQTGHTIAGPFLSYYDAHQGQETFGYPITEAMEHEGWQVQYFQFARLELHPENEPAYFVTVGWLGDLLHRRRPPVPERNIPPVGNADRRYFPESGHTVTGVFLDYFEANGDTVRFGRPISEPFLQDGLIVQDFQSARLIWRPDLPPGQQVQLAPIGETYFLTSDLPFDHLQPLAGPTGAQLANQDLTPGITIRNGLVRLEPTPRPGVMRARVYLEAEGQPAGGVPATLVIEAGAGRQTRLVRPLPPTRSSGESHILLDLSTEGVQAPLHISLFDETQTTLLGELAVNDW